ncbi:SDR family oxidoreductase [Pseudorhodoferax sp. LjRoot39]|uniref:SDR family oxidoreductase n=1 Tax=Pseudorhodoferax sp. LjRoot39 TaxID=3342328 RepID=UPI003ED13A2C
MSGPISKILVVGATGSIGSHVVALALQAGYAVRALTRDVARAADLPAQAERVVGDVAHAQTLESAVEGVDAIVFTHGAQGQGKLGSEQVDYGAVRNILAALKGRTVRIALMTAIGVTDRTGSYNRSTEAHDWKRRAERLVRASGLAYTIVRPGWFDYQEAGQNRLVFLQGDRRHAGTPADGVVARRQIAQVLVASLASAAAERKTLELVAEHGAAQHDLDPLFLALQADPADALDAVRDLQNMPLGSEPERVRNDLARMSSSRLR